MRTILYSLFLLISIKLNAQSAFYSEEVKSKMDQNKVNGIPTLSGIQFEHKVLVNSGLSGVNYKNNDSGIRESLAEIKNSLEFQSVDFERTASGDLLIYFIDEVENPIDAIKNALTNKNFITSSFEVTSKIVE